jgi:fluoroacetyl-CoA thioesterase
VVALCMKTANNVGRPRSVAGLQKLAGLWPAYEVWLTLIERGMVMQPEFNNLKVGLRGEAKVKVTADNVAPAFGSGEVDVFATPALVALVEAAAQDAIKGCLPPGWTTVGMEIKLKHFAPSPPGMEVVGKAVLEDIVGRRLVFSVRAYDESEQVSSGQHHRFIVNMVKFKEQAQAKKKERMEDEKASLVSD